MDPRAQRIQDLEELAARLAAALEQAPHKHVIDFQLYWNWYDGQRAAVLADAAAALKIVHK